MNQNYPIIVKAPKEFIVYELMLRTFFGSGTLVQCHFLKPQTLIK